MTRRAAKWPTTSQEADKRIAKIAALGLILRLVHPMLDLDVEQEIGPDAYREFINICARLEKQRALLKVDQDLWDNP